MDAPTVALEALGFTPTEAEVYVLLVQRPASTGYRVAQELGKAAAGVYKALDSLSRKGAVVVDQANTKAYRAIPASEMIGQLERRQREERETARSALARLETVADDTRIYQLQTFDQVLERARGMLDRAEGMAVVDLFPKVVDLIRPDVERAAKRGVRVWAKLYAPAPLDVFEVVVTPEAERLLDIWTASWLNVVIDAREHLLSLLDVERSGVHHATWSGSRYLSILYHSGITAELQMDAYATAILAGKSGPAMRKLHDRLRAGLSKPSPLGVAELLANLPPT